MKKLDGTLVALAEPTRRGIVDLLSQRPHRAGELAEAFDMSPPAMSRHLRVLRTRGIVEEARAERDARLRVFQLRRGPFDELSAWIAGVEQLWNDQLDSFKQHVARRAKGKRS